MAAASAGPDASLHLAPDRQPHQHPTTQFFTGRMPFLPPNQQCQSTEGKVLVQLATKIRMHTVSLESTSDTALSQLLLAAAYHYVAEHCPSHLMNILHRRMFSLVF